MSEGQEDDTKLDQTICISKILYTFCMPSYQETKCLFSSIGDTQEASAMRSVYEIKSTVIIRSNLRYLVKIKISGRILIDFIENIELLLITSVGNLTSDLGSKSENEILNELIS